MAICISATVAGLILVIACRRNLKPVASKICRHRPHVQMYMCVPTGMYILHSELEFNVAAVIKAHFKSAPEGEEPRTREEEEEGDKMQANPSYLPIETSYKSQEHQYMNVKMAPQDVADVEEHAKLQVNPSYMPFEMSYASQESKYINTPT